MFEQFPYTDMHQLNLDWIVKIAKDFLDQYTHIQQLISDGETSLDNKTQTGIEQLTETAATLTAALNAWYEEHSSDISEVLADAITALNQAVTNNLQTFQADANDIASATIASIPQDYTTLYNTVRAIYQEIMETTYNLFNSQDITVGVQATGNPSSTRALSHAIAINTSTGGFIQCLAKPANIKWEIEAYSGPLPSDRTGSVTDWYTSAPATYEYASGRQPYIRILFGTIDDSEMTAEKLNGIKFLITSGTSTREYVNYYTAIDSVARAMTSDPLMLKQQKALRMDLPVNWQSGTLRSGEYASSITRIVSDYIEVENGCIWKINFNGDSTHSIEIDRYDDDQHYLANSGWISADRIYSGNLATRYIRIIMKKNDDSYIGIDEVFKTGITIEYNGKINKDYLKILSYNAGRFSYGEEPYGLTEQNYQEKLTNLRRFIQHGDYDVICFQEWQKYINNAGTVQTNNVLFSHSYPYVVSDDDRDGWEAIACKYPMDHGLVFTDPDEYRYYARAAIQKGDKTIFMLNVHLSPGYTPEQAERRAAQVDDIINMVSEYEYCIITGDFNPTNGEETALYKKFTDAGFNIANCGYYGKYFTWSSNPADYTSTTPTGNVGYVENIITTSNITIEDVQAYGDEYNKLASDHIPFAAILNIH